MRNTQAARRALTLFCALVFALLFTFTAFADDELTVTITGISNGQTEVTKNPTFTLKFSESVPLSSLSESYVSLTDSSSNEIPLDVRIDDAASNTVTVSPRSPLTPGASYIFTVRDTVTSDNGHRLAGSRMVSFTVATEKTTTITTTTEPAGTKNSDTTTTAARSSGQKTDSMTSAPPVSTRIARSVRGRDSSGNTEAKTTKASRTSRDPDTSRSVTTRTATTRPVTSEPVTAAPPVTYTVPEETSREILQPTTHEYPTRFEYDDEGYTVQDYTAPTYTQPQYNPVYDYTQTVPATYPNIDSYTKPDEPEADNRALPLLIAGEVLIVLIPVALFILFSMKKAKKTEDSDSETAPAEESAPESEETSGNTEETAAEESAENPETAENEEITDDEVAPEEKSDSEKEEENKENND